MKMTTTIKMTITMKMATTMTTTMKIMRIMITT